MSQFNGDWAGSIPKTLEGVVMVEIILFLDFLGRKGEQLDGCWIEDCGELRGP